MISVSCEVFSETQPHHEEEDAELSEEDATGGTAAVTDAASGGTFCGCARRSPAPVSLVESSMVGLLCCWCVAVCCCKGDVLYGRGVCGSTVSVFQSSGAVEVGGDTILHNNTRHGSPTAGLELLGTLQKHLRVRRQFLGFRNHAIEILTTC